MKKYLRIGEMAALNHVSTQTLRLYAKNKLLEPKYLDEQTGYRYYTYDQCARLDLVNALKSCRLSLQEIRNIFSLSVPEDLINILKAQEEQLSHEIYNLLVSRNNLARLHKNLQILNTLPPFEQPYLEYQEERCIDVHHTDFDFYKEGYSGYEHILREMQNYLYDKHLPPSYFINIGTTISQKNFDAKNFTCDNSFIFVDDLYPARDNLKVLPEGMYLCLASDDPNKELELASKLHEEIINQGLHSTGDYICEVLTHFPFYDDQRLVYKIQIPVIKQ